MISLNLVGKFGSLRKAFHLKNYASDVKTQDAVFRNFEVIGEASRRLPDEIKSQYGGIE